MRVWPWCAPLAALLAACLDPRVVTCEDGRICPNGTQCDEIHALCVRPEQLERCATAAEGAPCQLADGSDGVCTDGVCIITTCGDGIATGGELCDGADLDKHDCTELGFYEPGPVTCDPHDCTYDDSACQHECGDGTVDTVEQCDTARDTSVVLADCAAFGYYEAGDVTCTPSCTFDVSRCRGRCGDGVHDAPESCEPGVDLPIAGCLDFGFDAGAIGCSAFCTPGLDTCRDIDWEPATPAYPVDWHAVWMAGPDEYWAVGSAVLHVTGTQAVIEAAPAGVSLQAIAGRSPTDVWAVGLRGQLWHWDGTAWAVTVMTNDPPTPNPSFFGVWPLSPTSAIAVGPGVWRYDGTGWTTELSTPALYSVWASGPDDIHAVGWGGRDYHYDGTAWTQLDVAGTPEELHAVWGTGPDDVFAAGTYGALFHYDGTTWSAMASGTTADLTGLWGGGPADVFAVGAGGTVLHFDGAHWWPLAGGTTADLQGISGGSGARILVGTDVVRAWPGAGWSVTDTGVSSVQDVSATPAEALAIGGCAALTFDGSWSALAPTCAGAGLAAVWSDASGAAFVSEQSLQIWRRAGATWTADPWSGGASGLWGAGPDDVYAASITGLGHWNGAGWASVPTTAAAAEHVWRIDGTRTDDVFGAGGARYLEGATQIFDGALFHWDGATWSDMPLPAAYPFLFTDVYAAAPDDVFAVGDVGTILHWDGAAWAAMASGSAAALYAIDGTSGHDVFAVGTAGTILHYDGTTWAPVRAPVDDDLGAVSARPDLVLVGSMSDGHVLALVRDPAW